MIIVLLRHGPAEKSNSGIPDAERQLTGQGLALMNKSLPGVSCFLDRQSGIRIWSSPFRRAAQTADCLAGFIPGASLDLHDFLIAGDFREFHRNLAGLPEETCLIVVGHEPWLGEWAETLCGCHLPFAKGAAAAVRIDPRLQEEGRLLWFAQPDALAAVAGKCR